MADIEELKVLVDRQVRDAANSRKMVDDLIAQMARAAVPPGEAPVVDNEALAQARATARDEKISKIAINLRKISKVKEFRDASEMSVKE